MKTNFRSNVSRYLWWVAPVVLAIIVAGAWFAYGTNDGSVEPGQHRRTGQPFFIKPASGAMLVEGKQLYGMYCASCHGANMEGQPNWRQRMANGRLPAPPHDESGHTWHHADAQLVSMVRDGFVPGVTAPVGYESDMPAYGEVLSDAQIERILAYIKTYWPEDALQAQREISLQ